MHFILFYLVKKPCVENLDNAMSIRRSGKTA